MRYLLLGAAGGLAAGALLAVVLLLGSGSTYEWLDSVLGTAPVGLLPGLAVGALVQAAKAAKESSER